MRGIKIRVSEYVPEMVQPLPCKKVGETPARRGGMRTDFGRYFRADSFARGSASPAPLPMPGYFMLDGVCHMHPKVFAKLEAQLKPAETGDREEER